MSNTEPSQKQGPAKVNEQSAALVIKTIKAHNPSLRDEDYGRSELDAAIAVCLTRSYTWPLSLAVIADSLLNGGFTLVGNRVSTPASQEPQWITRYLVERHNWLSQSDEGRAGLFKVESFINMILGPKVFNEINQIIIKKKGKRDGSIREDATPASYFAELVRKNRLKPASLRQIINGGNWGLATPFSAHQTIITEKDATTT